VRERARAVRVKWPLFFLGFALMSASGCGQERAAERSCPALLDGWYGPATGAPVPRELMWRVDLAGGTIRWNGDPIDEEELAARLRTARQLSPVPIIMFDPGGAESCVEATRLRNIIHRQFDCAANTCWQGSQQDYRSTPLREGEVALPW
jgi:hypothetical protein